MAKDLNAHSNLINQIYRYLSTDLISEAIDPGSYVLDCGAGDGAVAFPIAEKGCRVVCLDMSEERLRNIEAERGDLDVEVEVGDVNAIPFPDNTFDAVFSRMVLPMQPDWQVTVGEKLRVCKPGGVVAFHHNNQDNLDLSVQLASSEEHKKYVEKGLTRKGRANVGSLEKVCRAHGATLERTVPLSFFLKSSLLFRTGMLEDELDAYETEVNRRLADPNVYEFVDWFEREVVKHLPLALSGMMVVVLRKN